jgi:hypothetical protein
MRPFACMCLAALYPWGGAPPQMSFRGAHTLAPHNLELSCQLWDGSMLTQLVVGGSQEV